MSAATSAPRPASWRLHGRPLWIAVLTTLLLLVMVLVAAALDLASPIERRQVPLDLVALTGKLVIAVGLGIEARRTSSASMALLAGLAALLATAGAMADTAIVDASAGAVGDVLADLLPLSGGVAHLGLLFIALGLAALGLLAIAWRKARPEERHVVAVLIVMFALVGVFTGPVNAVAAAGINREWLFAEDLGQAVVLAVMAGYVAGLAVRASRQH